VINIGDSVEKQFEVYVCTLCDGAIDDTGLCDWKCENDDEHLSDRPTGTVKVRTWRRVDTLLSEEVV
jgi:hypothetical protein